MYLNIQKEYKTKAFAEKMLTDEENRELVRQYQSGNKKVLDKLIRGNQRIVMSAIKWYQNNGVEDEDLLQEGNIGLMVAADKFNLNQTSTKFTSYAFNWIRHKLQRALEGQGNTICMPVPVYQQKYKIKKAIGKLIADLFRKPTFEEIAEETGIAVEKVAMFCSLDNFISLDIRIEMKDGASWIAEVIADENSQKAFDEVEDKLMESKINEILSFVTERQEKVLRARIGLNGEPRTLKSIAEEEGITIEGVRQINRAAINKIRNNYRSANLLNRWVV